MRPEAFYFDLNSCAPDRKRAAAELITAARARHVDVAVMAPVHPKLNLVPLLVSGPSAADAVTRLRALPMVATPIAGPVGAASAIKMIRSVMVKGLEALTAECLLAARASGVEAEVLASLAESHGGVDWAAAAAYNLERMATHGTRRAAEMREAAETLTNLGLPADITNATVLWQDRMAGAAVRSDGAADQIAAALGHLTTARDSA